jgi:hypothetical protein
MLKLTHYFGGSIVALVLAGSSVYAGDILPPKTADWQDGYAPAYSGFNAGYGQPGGGQLGNSPYGQWSPSMNSPNAGPAYVPYSQSFGGGQFSNPNGGYYPGQGRQGCHHGSCRQSPYNTYGGGSMPPMPGYVNPAWGNPGSGPNYGTPYGIGGGPSLGSGAGPTFQSPGGGFGPATNFSSPAYPGQSYPGPSFPGSSLSGAPFSGQSIGSPNSSFNPAPNSFNPQPNLYNQQRNSFGQGMNSFGNSFSQPQSSFGPLQTYGQPQSFGQPGASYGQPGSNYGQQGPSLGQPQSSPFYP